MENGQVKPTGHDWKLQKFAKRTRLNLAEMCRILKGDIKGDINSHQGERHPARAVRQKRKGWTLQSNNWSRKVINIFHHPQL